MLESVHYLKYVATTGYIAIIVKYRGGIKWILLQYMCSSRCGVQEQ